MIVAITAYGFTELFRVFVEPQRFKERVETNYLEVSNSTEIFRLSSQSFIPAIQIVDYTG